VTSATFQRRRLFQVTANAELFLETLQRDRREGHYKLHAFVVMPDHIHLLLTPQDITMERATGFIKAGFSHRIGPVRARIVESCESYPYSSAYRIGATKKPPD